jgi:hypothetical protein
MDLIAPRGDGVDHSDGNVKLEFEPRAFFADQFEVGLVFSLAFRFFSPPFMRRPGLVGSVYVLRPEICP